MVLSLLRAMHQAPRFFGMRTITVNWCMVDRAAASIRQCIGRDTLDPEPSAS
jgi:hypothetical protein